MVDVTVARGCESADFHRCDAVRDESHQNVVTSSENVTHGARRHSTVHTALLLSAILAQLRYITADMRRHGRRAEVKDDWKLVAKVIDRLLLVVFIVIITALTVAILCLYPTLSNTDRTFS